MYWSSDRVAPRPARRHGDADTAIPVTTRRRRSTRVLTGLLAAVTAIATTVLLAPSASASLQGAGPVDPATNFPVAYTDGNGLALELCLGLPYCLSDTDLLAVHEAGGDAEAFYYAADATAGPFELHDALEAAYAADGPAQEVVFQRTQVRAQKAGLPANTDYTVTDPYGTFTCRTNTAGEIPSNGCRIETAPVPQEFGRALTGRIGPFLTLAPSAATPPAGYIGDNATPSRVVGSPTGFNAFRVEGPGLTGTCAGGTIAGCVETELFVVQGKVQAGGASASVSAGTLDFGDVPGTPAGKKTLTYANTGSVPVTVGAIEVSGEGAAAFVVDSDCPVAPEVVDVGARCAIDVTFTPRPGAASAATLTITDDTPTATRTVALKGSNLGVLKVDNPVPPAGLVFPSQPIGSSSDEDNVVIGNAGNGPLSIASATIGGSGAAHFRLGPDNTCTTPVDPEGGCEIGVVFAPTTTGGKTANLRVTDANGTIANVPLSGTGATPAPVTAPPGTPAIGSATAGNGQATVTWTTPADRGNPPLTGYEVQAFAGGSTTPSSTTAVDSAGATSATVTGLTNGTSYTFRVVATNGTQDSPPSGATTAVTPRSAPGAPTGVAGTAGDTAVALRWTAPANTGGAAVTGYSVRVFSGTTLVRTVPVGNVVTTNVTALTNGTTYTFDVAAVNAAGTGAFSARSAAVTPAGANPPPTVTARTPAVDATSVPVADNITATFSEAVQGVAGTTFQVKTAAGAVVAAAAPTRNGTTNQWILNPSANLAADTSYTVTLTGGATGIRDSGGAALATVGWSFRTGPAPTITTRTPASGATAVSTTGNITATFSEPVTGVSGSAFVLKNAAGTQVAATVTYNATTRVATLDPTATLPGDTRFTATLTGGATAIRDTAGNQLVTSSWSFLTGAAPTITARSPLSAATGVSRTANVTATFSEAVAGVSGTTVRLTNATTGAAIASVVSYNATTRVATLNPSATLTARTRYTLTVTGGSTAVRDAAGNALATTSWSFTTGA